MSVSRPVMAFALLRQAGDLLQTDLLGGVSVLIKPLVSDLSGKIYDASQLADRMASAYGISLPASALEAFRDRLEVAGILQREELSDGFQKVVFAEQDALTPVTSEDEQEFQSIIDDFLAHVRPILEVAGKGLDEQVLVSSFLTHLSTLDFSAIHARPIINISQDAGTIQGPTAKERQALSEQLAQGAEIDVLVASYISKLRVASPDQLITLAKVADAALGVELVLDLQAPSSVPRLSSTTAIVDTPLLLSYLDLSSKQDHEAAKALIRQLVAVGAKVAAYSHSIDEAEGVLAAIQSARTVGSAYGPSVPRMSNSVYRAFFESMRGHVGSAWQKEFEIIQETATHFYKNFGQDAEEALAKDLQQSLLDRRLTRERDAKSVAETMRRLGGGSVPASQVFACKFMFVTGNRTLQLKVAHFLRAWNFVRNDEFTPVVTDRYISGLCWLIAGGKSEDSPSMARLLANCATALRMKPELADRTKRFIAALDEVKARHFEALMTNERASQFLTEVTVGNPDVLTTLDADRVIDEMQRRVAETVAKEKDDYYGPKIADLDGQLAALSEREEVLERSLESAITEAKEKSTHAERLVHVVGDLTRRIAERDHELSIHASTVKRIDETLKNVVSVAERDRAQLKAQQDRLRGAASRYADRRFTAARVGGAIFLFVIVALLGYVDKFLTPTLGTEYQKYVNIGQIFLQALLGVLGLGILVDRLITGPVRRWRDSLYKARLTELGCDLDEA